MNSMQLTLNRYDEDKPDAVLHEAFQSGEEIVPSRSTVWTRFLALLRESRMFAIGLVLVAIALFLAAFGPVLAPFDPTAATASVNVTPSAEHWFGTDQSGLDMFSRVIAAYRIDVSIAIVATLVSLVAGSLVGLPASYFGGRLGDLVLRASDLVQAFPLFVLAIIYVTMAGRNVTNIVLVVSLLCIPIYVRLIRTQVLTLRNRRFVEAARASGDSEFSIAFRHVLPNAMAPGLAQASVTLGWSIIVTAGLSFVGAGVRPPTPEWGSMIASGANGIIIGQWWTAVFPGVAMSLSVFGFAAVSEGLQRILLQR